MARSTFPSQNVQTTPFLDHFWKLRCRKSARHFGAKHMSKSKWAPHVRTTVGRSGVVLRGRRKTLPKLAKGEGFVAVSTTTTKTLHYTTTTSTTTLHYANYITLHSTQVHYTTSITLHYAYATRHYTTLHSPPLHYTPPTTLQSISLHYTTTTLHPVTLYTYTTTTTTATTTMLQLRLS